MLKHWRPILVLLLVLTAFLVAPVLAQDPTPEKPFDWAGLLLALTPVLTFVAAALWTWLQKTVPGSTIVWLVVGLSAISMVLQQILGSTINPVISFIVGTFSIVVEQILSQQRKRAADKATPEPTGLAKFVGPPAVILALLLMSAGAQAQTWQNFWQPAPLKDMQRGILIMSEGSTNATGISVLEFKPIAELSAMQIRPGNNSGVAPETDFFTAAGVGLAMQNTVLGTDGKNYAQWSITAAILMSGSTQKAPTFEPMAAILFGVWNNLFQIGPGYDFRKVEGRSQWSIVMNVGVNLTNN